jgi:hypothetical protein
MELNVLPAVSEADLTAMKAPSSFCSSFATDLASLLHQRTSKAKFSARWLEREAPPGASWIFKSISRSGFYQVLCPMYLPKK